jgi:fluoroacetyl-CoA thioesterase
MYRLGMSVERVTVQRPMKSTLIAGLTFTRTVTVDESRVIGFMGDDCRVYATPRIISDVEYTCRNFLLDHLDPGEDSVGTRVNVEHVGPALLGAVVQIEVKLVAVDGRRIAFEANVKDGNDEVLRGTHERFIVNVEKVRERLLRRKAQQAQQQQQQQQKT